MRGGFIIPYQETFSITIKNSRDLRNYPTEIMINPDENYGAQGEVVFDDDDVYTLQNKTALILMYRCHRISMVAHHLAMYHIDQKRIETTD